MLRAVAIIVLAAIGAIGVYGAFYVGFTNGFFSSITKGLERQYITGCPTPFKMTYTNFGPLDGLLQKLVPFFCIAVDGKQTWGVTLSNWYLAAQVLAAWTLVCLEGLRRGNKGSVAGWTTALGVIFQTASYTFTMPIYLIFHLLTSPVGQATASSGWEAIVADAGDIDLVPASVVLTLGIPSVLMALPSPSVVTVATHYNLLAFWQGFPIWHALLFYTLKLVLPSRNKSAQSAAAAARMTHLRSIVPVYKFALVFAVAAHLAVLGISLTPASAVPAQWSALFSQVDLWTLLPGSLTSPPSADISGAVIPDVLAPLAAYLLKFDIHCGNAAILAWAVYLHAASVTSSSFFSIGSKVVFWTMIGGSVAPAVVLLWERDQFILSPGAVKKA